MFILRQSTSVDVLIGPFVDGTDGVSTEEALSPSVQLSKNGQTAGTKNEATTPAHDNAGYYNCIFDATDTGTVGTLVAFVEGTTASFLQVRHEFQIMDTAAFDALFADGAEGPLQATSVGNKLDVSAGGEAGLDWANIGSPTTAQNLSATNIDVDQVVASVSGSVASVTAGVTLAAGAVTNASLAENMEIVFETDFGTNYNQVDNAWVTNGTSFIGTGWNVNKTGYALTTADWNTGKTGYSLLATTGLGAQTANITGNLSGSVGSVTAEVTADAVKFGGATVTATTAVTIPASSTLATTAGAVGSVAGNVDGDVTGSVGSNLELGPTEVNAQVLDVLKTDTMTQSTLCPQEAPPVNATMEEAIAYLYKAWRNRSTQTATTYSLYADDATTQDQKATVSDDATTADKGEVAAGT